MAISQHVSIAEQDGIGVLEMQHVKIAHQVKKSFFLATFLFFLTFSLSNKNIQTIQNLTNFKSCAFFQIIDNNKNYVISGINVKSLDLYQVVF